MERKADPRIAVIPDIHGHAKGEHKAFAEERPIPYTARMLFLWFFHACRRSSPRFLMVADHMNYLTFEDPAAVNLVRRALKLAQAGDLYGAAETAGVELGHAAVVSEGLRRGMRYSIGAEIDNDPRCRPDAQNIVDAMKPDGMIRSIHFLPIVHPQHGENWMWAFDNPEFKDLYDVVGPANVWEIYMATLLDAIDKLPGNIVGHFYVPAKFGHWPEDDVLDGYEDRFVAACAERGMAIEINSRYFYKYYAGDDAQIARYRSAYLRLLGKAKAANVMIAVGSDAHSPKDQGNAFDTVLELLDEADVNEIAFPLAGRLARVALRATEEIIKAHAAALVAPVAPRPAPRADDVAVETDADGDDEDDSEREAATPAVEPAPVAAQAAPVAAPARPSRSRSKAKLAEPLETASPEVDVSPQAAAEPEPEADAAAVRAAESAVVAPELPKKRSHKKVVAAPIRDAAPVAAAPVAAAPVVAAVAPIATDDPIAAQEPDREAVATEPHAPAATKAAKSNVPSRTQPSRSSEPLRVSPARGAVKPTAAPAKAKPARKAAPVKAAAAVASRKAAPKRPSKAAAPAATPAKPSRTKAAPAKKSAKKTVAKTAARPTAAKKTSAKPAARVATKKAPPKRAAAPKKPAAKASKRPAAAKPVARKKVAPKKPVAKKKTARARR